MSYRFVRVYGPAAPEEAPRQRVPPPHRHQRRGHERTRNALPPGAPRRRRRGHSTRHSSSRRRPSLSVARAQRAEFAFSSASLTVRGEGAACDSRLRGRPSPSAARVRARRDRRAQRRRCARARRSGPGQWRRRSVRTVRPTVCPSASRAASTTRAARVPSLRHARNSPMLLIKSP